MMALEDFEKSLVADREIKEHRSSRHDDQHSKAHRHHGHHRDEDREHHHRHKRRKRAEQHGGREQEDPGNRTRSRSRTFSGDLDCRWTEPAMPNPIVETKLSLESTTDGHVKRDPWMEQPSALDIDYTQMGAKKLPEATTSRSAKADFELKIHDNELNKHHLQDLAEGKETGHEIMDESDRHEVSYAFGDAGAQWRITKLKGVYRRAREQGRSVDIVAKEQFGDLRSFDEAREEQIELERRETYGEGYVGKEKPSGDLFEERKLDAGIRNHQSMEEHLSSGEDTNPTVMYTKAPLHNTPPANQTALNRLKAKMLKSKLGGGAKAVQIEQEYNSAVASFTKHSQPDIVMLGAMETRMLAGGRKGEVMAIDSKRGRERGLVEENEDMTIDDMVREERRTRGQAGGDGRQFAERIAKDGKFDNGLDYMDENAAKLAKRVQRSEINLKNIAISDFQKMNRILDACPLCHHEDIDTPPLAPIVSLATRVYLTLPTEPEISEGGACIIPVQHRNNLLECDDDEWEEIRNFMKSLTRMYHDQGRDVIFYENAAAPHRRYHAGMQVVPLPYSLGETAPAFFKEAIMTSDEEWTQHKKVIDTLARAKKGTGKLAFRRSLVKEMPYFHVWFEIDGGIGHIVEDFNRWPKGDLFAREIIGGMLDKGPDVIKRQGRWNKGGDGRVDGFRKRWKKFDWTRVLTDGLEVRS